MKKLLLLSVSTVLLAPILAEIILPTVQIPIPGPLEDAVFGKVVSGDFDGNGELDAVVLDGGVPSMLISPEVFYTDIKVKETDGTTPRVVNDIAVMPGSGPNGEDVLFLVDDQGLLEVPFDAVTGWGTAVVHDDDDWAGALLLQLGDVNADTYMDAVGVDADGQTVRVLFGDSSGGLTLGSSFFSTVGTAAHDLQLFELNPATSDPGLEIAVFTNAGIGVHNELGVVQSGYTWNKTMIAGVIDDPTLAGAQRLVVVTKVGGKDYLFLWDRNGKEKAINLGPKGTVRMAIGDLRGSDDLDDVLLSVTSKPGYYVLEQQPSGPTFSNSPTAMTLVDVGVDTRDTSTNDSGLAVGDYDNDGDQDVLAFASVDGANEGEFVLTRRGTAHGGVDETQWRFTRTPVTGAGPNALTYAHGEVDPVWHVRLTRPLMFLDTEEFPGTAEVEYSLWYSPHIWNSFTSETPVVPESYITMPLAPGSAVDLSFTLGGLGPNGTDPMDEDDLFTLIVRPVVRNNGVVVKRGTAMTLLMTTNVWTNASWAFRGVYEAQEVVVYEEDEFGTLNILPDPVGGGSGSSSGSSGSGSDEDTSPLR